MLMIYIKKIIKFLVLFRASFGKKNMKHINLAIFYRSSVQHSINFLVSGNC